MYRVLKLKESESKEYRYITTHGIGPGTVPEGTFIRSEDLENGKTAIYLNRPLSDEELKKYDIKPEWIQESLVEAEEDELENVESDEETEEVIEDQLDAEETKEDLEDTVDSEEDQDENAVEEESQLDTQLDEIRDVIIDLDLRLYKIMNDKEEFYIIGRLDKDSNTVEMLVDTQPAEEVNVDIEEGEEEIEKPLELDDNKEIETRFDYVKLPTQFEQIKDMFPRYGEDLTPDHEAIMEYLMNLLIEQNPRAAKEREEEPEDEEVEVEIEPIEEPEEVEPSIEITGEEDLEDED